MSHKLSITGEVETLYSILPELDEIYAEGDGKKIVFSAATSDKMSALKEKLVSHISDIIIASYETGYRGRLIEKYYKNLTSAEVRDIIKKLEAEDGTAKRKYIEKEIESFLPESDTLLIDGFVNFRLQDYKKKVKRDVDRAVSSYIAEREYEEFLSLLRCFVEIQSPREEITHVVPQGDGSYFLYNHKLSRITSQGFDELEFLMDTEDLSYDDLLLSSLITLAPEKIIIHKPQRLYNTELAQTICKIFEGGVTFCDGCKLCNNIHKT